MTQILARDAEVISSGGGGRSTTDLDEPQLCDKTPTAGCCEDTLRSAKRAGNDQDRFNIASSVGVALAPGCYALLVSRPAPVGP